MLELYHVTDLNLIISMLNIKVCIDLNTQVHAYILLGHYHYMSFKLSTIGIMLCDCDVAWISIAYNKHNGIEFNNC